LPDQVKPAPTQAEKKSIPAQDILSSQLLGQRRTFSQMNNDQEEEEILDFEEI
jgi:hypothetical protein